MQTADKINNPVDSRFDSKYCFQSQYINNAHAGATWCDHGYRYKNLIKMI